LSAKTWFKGREPFRQLGHIVKYSEQDKRREIGLPYGTSVSTAAKSSICPPEARLIQRSSRKDFIQPKMLCRGQEGLLFGVDVLLQHSQRLLSY